MTMSVEKNDKLTQMKYGEWLASPFGACLVASALGAWLHSFLARRVLT